MGRWVEHAGFEIGSKVRVDVYAGRLVIELVEAFPEREPRLPPPPLRTHFSAWVGEPPNCPEAQARPISHAEPLPQGAP